MCFVTKVKDALNELDRIKLDITALGTNVTPYSTTSTFPITSTLSAFNYSPDSIDVVSL